MARFLARLWAKLKRLNGSANVSERMASSTHRDEAGGPRGGADGFGGGSLPPGY